MWLLLTENESRDFAALCVDNFYLDTIFLTPNAARQVLMFVLEQFSRYTQF